MSITAANAVLTFSFPGVFSSPQIIQGFATDDAFGTEVVEILEEMMGVDGRLSFGYTPAATPMKVVLQADSPSIIVFDTVANVIKAQREFVPCSATVVLKSTGRKYSLTTGAMKSYPLIPDVKKVLQPQTYGFVFQDATPSTT